MSYLCKAVFSGESSNTRKFHNFLKSATSGSETAVTLERTFGITITGLWLDNDGLLVTYESKKSSGKSFCSWACKECSITCKCSVEGYNAPTSSFSIPEEEPIKMEFAEVEADPIEDSKSCKETANEVERIDLDAGKKEQKVQQTAADAALQSMLESAREEGRQEGRFQILRNILNSCETLSDLLRLTGVTEEEFTALYKKFYKRS